jgi:hypothetical protein
METRKLVLEISPTLFEELERLAVMKEESMQSIAIRAIASQMPSLTREAKELLELLAKATPETLPEVIDEGEPIGSEVFW